MNKTLAVIGTVFATLMVSAGAAMAQTSTPASEAGSLFDSNSGAITDMLKTLAPKIIAFGLVLFAIRKVVNALSNGKKPKV